MNFFILYLIVPVLLFAIKPQKNNYLLVLYLFAIEILSYDNTTDYGFYFDEFQEYLKYRNVTISWSKGREIGWTMLLQLFSFTKYGIVIIHTIILSLVTVVFIYFSKKAGLLNVSVFLCFVLDLVSKHDNIWRQDIAMIFAYFAYFDILIGSFNLKKILRLSIYTIVAFSFHNSAILLIPFYFLVYWLSRVEFNWKIVASIVIVIILLVYYGLLDSFNSMLSILAFMQNEYTNYYLVFFMGHEAQNISITNIVLCLSSVIPLFYFSYYRPICYKTNMLLRLSVNLTCIIAMWTFFARINVLSRIFDYLIWFQIWGYGYFIMDIIRNKRVQFSIQLTALALVAFLVFRQWKGIDGYFGENTYLTIFSSECKDQKIYKRNPGRDLNEIRIRE